MLLINDVLRGLYRSMDDIYKYLLKNSTLNDLIEACLENKNIAIIISNNEIEDVLIYLKNYILNNITTEKLKKRVNAVSINHTIDMVKIKKFNILNREISNNKKKIMEIFLSFIKKDNEGKYQLNQTNKLDISKEGLGVSNYRIIYENYNDISKAKYGYVIISNGEKVSRVEITINDIYKYTADLELGRESMVLIKENLTPEESSGIRLDVKYFDDDNNELFQ